MTCQRISKEGKTVIVTVNSAFFEPSLVSRLHQVCDNNIRLENQTIGGRPMATLAAPRINNVDNLKSNGFSFRVESGSGIHAMPIFGVKV